MGGGGGLQYVRGAGYMPLNNFDFQVRDGAPILWPSLSLRWGVLFFFREL